MHVGTCKAVKVQGLMSANGAIVPEKGSFVGRHVRPHAVTVCVCGIQCYLTGPRILIAVGATYGASRIVARLSWAPDRRGSSGFVCW